MNELIKVQTNEQNEQVVSGRGLHEFLGVKTKYEDWFLRMAEYGFNENLDYHVLKNESVVNNRVYTKTDHVLKLDMAKEISMIQRTDKGKLARRYFLEIEKAWNDPVLIMGRALELAKNKNIELEAKVEEMKPKALFADSVSASPTSILVGDLAKILKQNGVDMGGTRLFEWLRSNGYLIKRRGDSWNMPTQRSMDLGLFEIKESTHMNSNGKPKITKTPKVTGKGQEYFVNKLVKEREEEIESELAQSYGFR